MASLSRTSLLRTLPRTTFKFAPPLPLLRTRLPPPTTLRRSPVLTATRTVTYRRFGDNNIAIRSSPWRPQSGGGRQKYIYWAAGLGAVWIVFHLERVPETGRWRYMDTSEALEISMGEQMYQETLDQFRGKILPPNHPTSRYVQKVAKRIIMASELPRSSSSEADMGEHHGSGSAGAARSEKIEWRVHVVNDPSTLNAFVAPGGKVFVFTGILPVCADEDGLAAVLAHEVAHQVARHMGERMSLAKIALLVAFGIDALLGIGVGASQAIVNLCLSLPNSRTNESEADHIGLNIMAKACYDPAAAQKMWERMEKVQHSSSLLQFAQTHPANQTRIKQIGKWLPEAERLREDRCGQTTRAWDAFEQTRSAWR